MFINDLFLGLLVLFKVYFIKTFHKYLNNFECGQFAMEVNAVTFFIQLIYDLVSRHNSSIKINSTVKYHALHCCSWNHQKLKPRFSTKSMF